MRQVPTKHVVVMGAGPAGLTAAYELQKHTVPVTVLESDPRYVGGIARTIEHDDYRFDIGGHRFFSKSQEIENLWSEVQGDDLLTCHRLSRIYYRQRYFDYPLKAANALHLAVIRAYVEEHLPNLSLVGRNGMYHYNNQDHSMMTALLAARNIATGTSFDVWKVNTDAEYHEEARSEDVDRSGRLVPLSVGK